MELCLHFNILRYTAKNILFTLKNSVLIQIVYGPPVAQLGRGKILSAEHKIIISFA